MCSSPLAAENIFFFSPKIGRREGLLLITLIAPDTSKLIRETPAARN